MYTYRFTTLWAQIPCLTYEILGKSQFSLFFFEKFLKFGNNILIKVIWLVFNWWVCVYSPWKVSKYRVFSGPYFPRIQTEYRVWSLFGLNTKNRDQKKLRIWDTFHKVLTNGSVKSIRHNQIQFTYGLSRNLLFVCKLDNFFEKLLK